MSDPKKVFLTSKEFKPKIELLKALETKTETQECETFESLNEFRENVHAQKLNFEKAIEGVGGPGGVPEIYEKKTKPLLQESKGRLAKGHDSKDPEEGEPSSSGLKKSQKRLRNVLTRMDAMIKGPLALLQKCRTTRTRIKVYTRNHSEVRGILTGYIIAFDKHWNMILKDVDEIYQKKIKCKTPAFDDESKYMCVGDLTIRDEDELPPKGEGPEDTLPLDMGHEGTREGVPSLVWRNPFKSESKEGAEGRSATCRGLRMDSASLAFPTSTSKDAKRLSAPLRLSDALREREESEALSEREERDALRETKRPRRRKKRELRQRHVNQMLVRGESVVLVAVLEP